MKKRIITIISAAALAFSMCACTAEQAIDTASDYLNSIATSDSPEVMSVKNGTLPTYASGVTVGDALDSFLSNPKWSYFTADTGEEIVQCVGGCTLNDEPVEAKVQFELNDGDTFNIYALGLNDISQDSLTISNFFEAVYDGL